MGGGHGDAPTALATLLSRRSCKRVDHSPHTALVEACAQPLALVSTPERALECHAGHCISRDALCVVACELSGEHHMAVSDVGTACAWLVEMSQCGGAFFSPSNTATTVRLCCSKSRGRHNHRACTLHRALCCGRVGVRLRKQGQHRARVACEQVAQNSKLRQSGWVPRIAICMPVSLRSCVREACCSRATMASMPHRLSPHAHRQLSCRQGEHLKHGHSRPMGGQAKCKRRQKRSAEQRKRFVWSPPLLTLGLATSTSPQRSPANQI
jgi:hypothetical protein